MKHGQSAILQFFYVSSTNANNLSFKLSINGTAVRTINVTGNFFGTIHEVFSGITKNGANTLDMAIVGGTGSVTISDILIFVQRSV